MQVSGQVSARQRHSRWIGAAALGALVVLASACAIDLGTLGGATSSAFGINDGGTVVGVAADGTGTNRAFRWTASSQSALDNLPGFTTGEARSINAGGTAVGWLGDGGAGKKAVRWPAGGGVVELSGLGGAASRANDVNAGGVAVGWSTTSGSTLEVATIWSAAGVPTALPLPGGTLRSEARAINDNGDIVGEISAFAGTGAFDRPVRWTGPSHTVVVLGPPAGFPDISREVFDIDTDGTAVGRSLAPVGGLPEAALFASRWPAGETAAIQFGGPGSVAYAVDDGIAVGATDAGARAWVLSSGKVVDLPGLSGGAGSARAIANGAPVGDSPTKAHQTHATRFDTVHP